MTSAVASPDEIITVRTIVAALLQRWWWIGLSAAVCALAGLALAFTLPEAYRAEAVVVAARESDGSNALSRVAGSIGSLTSLLGLPGGSGRDSQEVVATLTSKALIHQLIERDHLMPMLFAEAWDPARRDWADDVEKPTAWDAIERFRDILVVLQDPQTGLISVRVDWGDPVLAAKLANDLVAFADETLRLRALRRSKANLEYLRAEHERTTTIELQTALAELIQVEMQTIMMASGGSEYAVRTIDPAIVEDRPVSPRKLLLTVVFGMLGGTAALLVVGIRALNTFK